MGKNKKNKNKRKKENEAQSSNNKKWKSDAVSDATDATDATLTSSNAITSQMRSVPRMKALPAGGGGGPYPLPFPSNVATPKDTFLRDVSPYRESYRKAIETSYEGFAVDNYNEDDKVNHHGFDHDKIEKSMYIMNQHGYFRTDITQPFGLGTKLAKTYVTRCLLGEEGTTYKYLGLRMFSHPWTVGSKHHVIDPTLRDAIETIGKLNDTLTERTKHHLNILKDKRAERNHHETQGLSSWNIKGRAKFDVTLINRMTYSSDLKKEPTIGQEKCTVSWHADSSLEHYSSIAVYTLLCNDSNQEEDQITRSVHHDNLANKWSIALRVAHDSEGPSSSRRGTDIESSVVKETPMLAASLPSKSAYYLLDDFNHHHQHAVLVNDDIKTPAGVRYASTHRLLKEGHNVHFIIDRCKNTVSQFHRKSPKLWRSEQLLLFDIESEWIRQFYIQGSGHKHILWQAWEEPICELLKYWSLLEKRTKQVIDLLTFAAEAKCHNDVTKSSSMDRKEKKIFEKQKKALVTVEDLVKRGEGSTSISKNAAEVLFEPFSILLEERAKMRDLWKKREKDGVFKGMSQEYRPLTVPFQFNHVDTDSSNSSGPKETGVSPLPGSPVELYDLAKSLRDCAKAYQTQNSKYLPTKGKSSNANTNSRTETKSNSKMHEIIQSDPMAHTKALDWEGWKSTKIGLEMQQPYAGLLLDGSKTIETRAYDLPRALIGKKIFILQSKKGSDGVSSIGNIMTKDDMESIGLSIVGWCIFDKVVVYRYRSKFEKDQMKHLVPCDSSYGWKEDTKCIYGWVVKKKGYFKKKDVNVKTLIRRMRSLFEI